MVVLARLYVFLNCKRMRQQRKNFWKLASRTFGASDVLFSRCVAIAGSSAAIAVPGRREIAQAQGKAFYEAVAKAHA